jgi:hypothetical protein
MWQSLLDVYETKSYQTIVAVIQNLFHSTATDQDNILDHIITLKKYWECINLMDDDNFKISDIFFKVILSSSLPESWDTFTEPYVKGVDKNDPKKTVSSQVFSKKNISGTKDVLKRLQRNLLVKQMLLVAI